MMTEREQELYCALSELMDVIDVHDDLMDTVDPSIPRSVIDRAKNALKAYEDPK